MADGWEWFGATIEDFWNRILVAWQGKRVVVLGARGVGKSHLIRFLTTGSIPTTYKQTVAPEKIESRRVYLKELDLKLKNTLDMGGGKEARQQWKTQVKQADIILYLFRADHILIGKDDAIIRMKDDGHHLGEWIDEMKFRPHLCVVGTHCDLDPSFANLADNNYGDYVDKFNSLSAIRQFIRSCGAVGQLPVVVGSMRTLESTESLLLSIFRHVEIEP